MTSWYQRGKEDGKEYGEWGSLERGMVKSYQARVQQKAERSIVMESGWVESGRRTTLLCYLFGRRWSYSPRQLAGRHWQLTILQPGGLSHSYSGSRPNFRGKFPELYVRHGLAIGERTWLKSCAGIDALCCGSAWLSSYDAGAETEKWRGTSARRGWRGSIPH